MLTPEEHQSYLDELNRLCELRDRDLPELLRQARTFVAGDAAEEVIQIHADQAAVNARIAHLGEILHGGRIVSGIADPHVVALGRSVEIEYLRGGKVVTCRVAVVPAQDGARTVSPGSPIGVALLGRSTGDTVAAELPGGRVEHLRILSVSAADPAP
jgi:transcription elongation factor GreA